MKFKDFILLIFLFRNCQCYSIFEENVDFIYNIQTSVELIPDVSDDFETITQWDFNGTLRIQRLDSSTVAMQLSIERDEEELKPLMKPFILKSLNLSESSIFLKQHPQKAIGLSEFEPIWSANMKRAIVSLFQIEGSSENGAYVSNEFGLSGLCPTEYYVVNASDSLSISKIYDMDRCSIPGGIFEIRSNIPINICEMGKNKAMHAVTSRLGEYKLMKLKNSKYLLKSIHAESKSNVQASESYYPQFIFSKIFINLISQTELKNRIQFNESERMFQSDFTYVRPILEATGGRSPKTHDQVIETVINMLTDLAENLENKDLNFDEPYMEIISEILRLCETMNFDALEKLYDQIDIGTSYIQETSRNIFLEILPRIGTSSSVLVTKYLIMKKHVRPTTAVQLLTALPFFISELSYDLVKECEEFLHIGLDRPDVKHSAVLSYSTMIYKAYVAGALSKEQFEKYVKMVFDLFLNSFDYEQQMLYLEAMGNLQLGNVPNYLQPIIQADYSQTTDIRFLAIFATLPTAYSRPTEVFETYWPIFYSKTTPLQLRIAAFQMLLVSAQTPGRVLGLYNVIKNENCPHMINFYRTTILSISESTNSCLAHLKRLVLYMRPHLPPAPPKKYWITGNYIFDYKDRKFQIGSMVQVMLIGDKRRDLPLIAFLKFDTEAMGRFTGQLGVYIKARGLSDAILDRIYNMNLDHLKFEELSKILKFMKMQPIQSTPLHLEFIVQLEGKTILSYYLNQTTFYNLTDGDIINRINLVLRTDSHINMQLIRRPFIIKHGFSTLIGTPAYILLENTMIASIRGSTTQSIDKEKLQRNNQMDLRYSTYAVSKILSYNPLDDIEFSTIREQGFLVYLPINNEIKLNLLEKHVTFSLYRKEPITSGLSLKSRTRSFSGINEIAKQNHEIPVYKLNLDDIGINVLIGHNVESSKENLMFLFESDVATSAKVFTRTPYSIIQNILTVISMIQLTSIHISRDKHLTILLANEPNSKVELGFKYKTEDIKSPKEGNVVTIDCSLLHIHDYDSVHSKQLHKWEFSTKFTTFKNSKASKAIVSLNRKTINGEKWKLCIASTIDGLIHFKNPLKFTSNITFGNHDDVLQYCPIDKSKIDLTLLIGSPQKANETYEGINVEDPERCTKEIIKFSPVPQFKDCKTSDLEKVLSINDVKLDVNFEKMPDTFYEFSSRVDHIFSAFMPQRIAALNLSNYINLEVKLPLNENQETLLTINGNTIPLPFGCNFKDSSWEGSFVDYSLTSVCSLYKDNLNTLAGNDMILTENIRNSNSYNNEMLIFAECAEIPRLAILVEYNNDSNDFLQVKINAGSQFIIIKGDRRPVIFYDSKEYDLTDTTFEYPTIDSFIRISLNDDSLIEIENELLKAKIQYNMENLISISIPTIMKGKICGLCNVHKNKYC